MRLRLVEPAHNARHDGLGLGRVDLKKGGGAELKRKPTELLTNDRIPCQNFGGRPEDLVRATWLKIEGDALDLFPAFDPLLGQLFQTW